jgi:CIC family chloride channel protein
VGIAGGLGAVAFRALVQIAYDFFFGFLLPQASSPYFIILLPIIGGLIVGPMVYNLVPEARGDGIPHVMTALSRHGGEIRKRVGITLIFTSAITLGSGGSAGREGPIALIGASVGSFIGRVLKLTPREIKVLTTCGVAAGIAGTFNAPMGGAIFSMEVVSKRFSSSDAVPILLAAVVGKAVASSLIDPVPEFINPSFYFTSFDLLLCFLIGPLFGILSFLWVKTYYLFEDFFSWLPVPGMTKPAIGGIVAGIAGYYFPTYGIMGVGYEGINSVFKLATSYSSSHLLLLLITLGLLKILATCFTVGSGGSGGAFAPTLYIGTMFGLAAGMMADMAFPGFILNPLDYGLIGMGAFFAGAAAAPLTCIFMITEMTGNYSALPTLIVSCILSYTTAHFLLKGGSIYTIKLMRKGIYMDQPQPILEEVSVGEAMQKQVVTVDPTTTITQVRDLFAEYNYTGYPIVDHGKMVGIITFDDIRRVPLERQQSACAGEVALKEVITIQPHQSAKTAMDLMYRYGIGRLPVVSREDPSKLVGIITRTDVIKAYERESQRRLIDE